MNIAPEILQKLDRAINELLSAGWDVGKVTAALAQNQSYGKHDGCTPDAIRERAVAICNGRNAEARRVMREMMAARKDPARIKSAMREICWNRH